MHGKRQPLLLTPRTAAGVAHAEADHRQRVEKQGLLPMKTKAPLASPREAPMTPPSSRGTYDGCSPRAADCEEAVHTPQPPGNVLQIEKVRSKEMANGLSIIMDARVYSGSTYFEADVGLDTQFSEEICFSEHKASQLGCKLLKRKMEAGLADGSGMTMGIRWPQVRVMLRLENGDVYSELLTPACPMGTADPWDDEVDGTVMTSDEIEQPITLCVDEKRQVSPVKGGSDSKEYDIAIGWKGLKKMGLGIHPVTHKIVVAQPTCKHSGWKIRAVYQNS